MITSSRHILKAAVAIGLLTGLGACTNDMHYTGAETPKRNEVRMVRLVHDMRFDVAKAALSDAERARLHAFLDTINVQYGDRLSVDLGDEDQSALREALRQELKTRGLKLEVNAVVSGSLPLAGTGRLVVDRYTVSTPQCKPFSEQVRPDRNFAEGVNYGCSSTSLLGLMVADKRDLIEGKQDTPADAATATNAVTLGRATTGTSSGASTSVMSSSGRN